MTRQQCKSDTQIGLLRIVNYYSAQEVLVQCDCGTLKVVRADALGIIKSCGCYNTEARASRFYKHGYASKGSEYYDEYRAYKCMMSRCYNPTNASYKYYGSRSITVCGRWLNSLEAFIADMGKKPSKQHSLDRRDNDKGYSPDNCRWATKSEQVSNRRKYKWHGKRKQ